MKKNHSRTLRVYTQGGGILEPSNLRVLYIHIYTYYPTYYLIYINIQYTQAATCQSLLVTDKVNRLVGTDDAASSSSTHEIDTEVETQIELVDLIQ